MATLGDYLQRFLQLGKQKIASDAVQSGNWLANTVMGKPATYKAAPNPVGQIAREVGQDIVRKAVSTLPQNNTPVMRKVTEASALLNTPPIQAARSYAPVFAQSIKNAIYNKMNPPFVSPVPETPIQPSPIPKPTSIKQPEFRFDPSTVGIEIPSKYTFVPPTGVFAEALRKNFPKEATQAAVVGWAENATKPFDPDGYNYNTPGDKQITPGFEGSGDYGQMQINSKTMEDYLRRMPDKMKEIGISSVNDLKDPNKVAAFSALIRKYQGWGAWKGWQNKGITGL